MGRDQPLEQGRLQGHVRRPDQPADGEGQHRRGEIDGLEQLGRYLERLRPALGTVRGVLAAQAFTQQARTLAAARGINCVPLDYDVLRGMEPNTPTLF